MISYILCNINIVWMTVYCIIISLLFHLRLDIIFELFSKSVMLDFLHNKLCCDNRMFLAPKSAIQSDVRKRGLGMIGRYK